MQDHEMSPHPEGGRFKEVYRSAMTVAEGKRGRAALTHIYFALAPGEVSRFHRVASDEIWNLYEGDSLELLLWDDAAGQLERVVLSRKKRNYCFVVRAGLWQAARPIDGDILVGCSVAPGFEFEDFELIDPEGSTAAAILKRFPELTRLVTASPASETGTADD